MAGGGGPSPGAAARGPAPPRLPSRRPRAAVLRLQTWRPDARAGARGPRGDAAEGAGEGAAGGPRSPGGGCEAGAAETPGVQAEAGARARRRRRGPERNGGKGAGPGGAPPLGQPRAGAAARSLANVSRCPRSFVCRGPGPGWGESRQRPLSFGGPRGEARRGRPGRRVRGACSGGEARVSREGRPRGRPSPRGQALGPPGRGPVSAKGGRGRLPSRFGLVPKLACGARSAYPRTGSLRQRGLRRPSGSSGRPAEQLLGRGFGGGPGTPASTWRAPQRLSLGPAVDPSRCRACPWCCVCVALPGIITVPGATRRGHGIRCACCFIPCAHDTPCAHGARVYMVWARCPMCTWYLCYLQCAWCPAVHGARCYVVSEWYLLCARDTGVLGVRSSHVWCV